MRLALNLNYVPVTVPSLVDLAQFAEKLGYESAWIGEAYGHDAVSPLTWIAACTSNLRLGTGVLQMHARTPAATAMTATTIDTLSGGRFLLGLGVSGPQVVECWHGVNYGRPLEATREYVEIVRKVLSGVRVVHQGTTYQ